MDKGKSPIAIFLDFSKAFDSLNHKILLTKLSYDGVNPLVLKLLKSYLTDRKQFVYMQEHIYSLIYPKTGAPQGSILGPLLFLLYIYTILLMSALYLILSHMQMTQH